MSGKKNINAINVNTRNFNYHTLSRDGIRGGMEWVTMPERSWGWLGNNKPVDEFGGGFNIKGSHYGTLYVEPPLEGSKDGSGNFLVFVDNSGLGHTIAGGGGGGIGYWTPAVPGGHGAPIGGGGYIRPVQDISAIIAYDYKIESSNYILSDQSDKVWQNLKYTDSSGKEVSLDNAALIVMDKMQFLEASGNSADDGGLGTIRYTYQGVGGVIDPSGSSFQGKVFTSLGPKWVKFGEGSITHTQYWGESSTPFNHKLSTALTSQIKGTAIEVSPADCCGNYSLALGQDCSSGKYSLALGNHCRTTSILGGAAQGGALAIGSNCDASGEYSVAMGESNTAGGRSSVAMGDSNHASGRWSVAMGEGNMAAAWGAVAMGWGNEASGTSSVAMGVGSGASGWYAVAMGYRNDASGTASVAMGYRNDASGSASVAMGESNHASGRWSVAMGYKNTASGQYAVAMGDDNDASGETSVAMGGGNKARGGGSVAMGYTNDASGTASVAMGESNTAGGRSSVAMGDSNHASGWEGAVAIGLNNVASGETAVAMGQSNVASGETAVAMGESNTASGPQAVAMGLGNVASGDGGVFASVAMGFNNTASGTSSVAMGNINDASGTASVAMGWNNKASGAQAVAMGWKNEANGDYSVAIGHDCSANGDYSVAMGWGNEANGDYSVAMGNQNDASGVGSVAMGLSNTASGDYSVALGCKADTNNNYQFVLGISNEDTASGMPTGGGNTFFIDNSQNVAMGVGGDLSFDISSVRQGVPVLDVSGDIRCRGCIDPLSLGLHVFTAAAGGEALYKTLDSSGGGMQMLFIVEGSPGEGQLYHAYTDGTGGVQSAAIGGGSSGGLWTTGSAPVQGPFLTPDDASGIKLNNTLIYGTDASGLMVGDRNTVSGDYAVAMGNSNTASNTNAVAMGQNCSAGGQSSVAMGNSNTASNTNAVAMGQNCSAGGQSSVAMGFASDTSTPPWLGYDMPPGAYDALFVYQSGSDTTTDAYFFGLDDHGAFWVGNNTHGAKRLINGSGTKTFIIPHPEHDGKMLRHACIEAPTRGTNIYEYQLEATEPNQTTKIALPSYFKHINGRPRVYVTPKNVLSTCCGDVDEELIYAIILTEKPGIFNVMVTGVRKDPGAVKYAPSIYIDEPISPEDIPPTQTIVGCGSNYNKE